MNTQARISRITSIDLGGLLLCRWQHATHFQQCVQFLPTALQMVSGFHSILKEFQRKFSLVLGEIPWRRGKVFWKVLDCCWGLFLKWTLPRKSFHCASESQEFSEWNNCPMVLSRQHLRFTEVFLLSKRKPSLSAYNPGKSHYLRSFNTECVRLLLPLFGLLIWVGFILGS